MHIQYSTIAQIQGDHGNDYTQGYVDGIYAVVVRLRREGMITQADANTIDRSMRTLCAGTGIVCGGRDARLAD